MDRCGREDRRKREVMMLSPEQIAAYERDGYLSPLVAFEREQALACRLKLEAMERAGGGILHDRRRKMHLYLSWVDEIIHHPRILDAFEDLIGPDILLYHLTLWLKEPNSDARVSWHQDSTYFGLQPDGHVTAWIALSPSTVQSGCVKVIPGSHKTGQLRHHVGELEDNLFRTGQEIDIASDARTESIELEPGQFSLHHTWLHHGSMPNRSDDRRIGLGISYIPAHCRCTSAVRLTAMRVRGEDRYRHFDAESRPARDHDLDAFAFHGQAMQRWHHAREGLIAQAHAGTD